MPLSEPLRRMLHIGFAVLALAAIVTAALVVTFELRDPQIWLWSCLGVAIAALIAEVVLVLMGRRPSPPAQDAHEFEI